ncbi:type II toxin-antitoxin system MqsA family antitoxin [Pseudomonas putida]|uniref:type II toxin-antitoxin system MqsA family antitoxin n=1 Tax=Pseudomonas putida TaxID=303 RepID=UPI0018D97AE7|nr:type II toxin-antitoxin system MqsA family antitoxin [Pseudomonas putida]ELU0814224.1 type II toxin-antitoxin system MqsA family antitoxin [Pseudomonas putida]MBH3388720.1 type II toxin-antitoxin system MqsA family antitoxin [Pseudomonas putida]
MSHHTEICPVCGEGCLEETGYDRTIEYNGIRGAVRNLISQCDTCGCEQLTPSQQRHNRRALIAFHKKCDNRLSSSEVRTARKKMNLTQVEASQLFGGGKSAFAKYESDDVCQSEAMDKLIRLCWVSAEALMTLKGLQKGLITSHFDEYETDSVHIIDAGIVHSSAVKIRRAPRANYWQEAKLESSKVVVVRGFDATDGLIVEASGIYRVIPDHISPDDQHPSFENVYSDIDYDRLTIQRGLT